ncbi:MAG: hypothetical protein IK100_09610 [Muribaculaceae bacterium]|nr:hypothetical protein [Muribaculaceae bacterium]
MTTETTAVQLQQPVSVFSSIEAFENAQRMVKPFVNSNLVPANFKGDVGACLIALNMANRMGADPLQVMQSLYVVHGKPSFSSAFLIACFNQCGRYTAFRYEMFGEPGTDGWGCKAYTTEKATGELIEGVAVTIGMAKAEGWYSKAGSKWKTMPELMMRYRAATFLIRSVAPEIALGFQTTEEVRDVIDITNQSSVIGGTPSLEEVALQAIQEEAEPGESENHPEQPTEQTLFNDEN